MAGRRERVGGGRRERGRCLGWQGNCSSTVASTAAITTSSAGDVIVGAINLSRGLGHRTDSLAWTMSAASSSGVAILAPKAAP